MRLLVTLILLFVTFTSSSQICQGCRDLTKKPADINSKAVELYSNDFSDPADWSFSNTSSNNADWQITTNQSAAPIPFFQPAGFSSASNGFAIIDSDAQGGNETQDCIISLDTLISNCVSEPFIILRFYQMLRRFNDTTTVEVSNDGTNWTEFLCNPGLSNNDNTMNPQKVDINISSVAGNEDTVFIRFRYRASDAWFWAIDDVQILVQDQYDLEGKDVSFGTVGNWGYKLPYYQIPVDQIAPIEITGRVKNAGHTLQSDIIITSSTTDGFTGSSASAPLFANQSGTFDVQNLWTPQATLGTKMITTVASSSATDQDPSNDTLDNASLKISPKYYARSTDVRTGRVSNNFHQFGYETGNIFDIFSDATVTSAMVHVAAESTPGALLFARVYEAIDSVTFNLRSISDTVIVPSLMNDSVFRVRLIDPVYMEAGKSYLLTAGSTGSSTFPGLVMGTSNKAEIFTTFFLAENSTTWYSFTETPMVKMNFESVVDLDSYDDEKDELFIYPNPSTGIFTISTKNGPDDSIEITLMSTTGQIIEKSASLNEMTVDFSYLPNGTYFIQVGSSKSSIMEKIVILK